MSCNICIGLWYSLVFFNLSIWYDVMNLQYVNMIEKKKNIKKEDIKILTKNNIKINEICNVILISILLRHIMILVKTLIGKCEDKIILN